MSLIRDLSADMSSHYRNEGVIFPMVDMDIKEDMSWILGLSAQAADGRPAVISQAVRQDKLRMNHRGARAQTAVAMAVMRGMSPPPLVIDRPFVVWFDRAGLPFPIFSAYVTQEHWREPDTLD
ncbi:MAG: hypothetical protein UZ21_OP11001000318 [Microgenomates bacterium OLB22]|nr:MAG: hypothetical protein UZ21_OP11001000318 [Microgenomates bacterium OLB22]